MSEIQLKTEMLYQLLFLRDYQFIKQLVEYWTQNSN